MARRQEKRRRKRKQKLGGASGPDEAAGLREPALLRERRGGVCFFATNSSKAISGYILEAVSLGGQVMQEGKEK